MAKHNCSERVYEERGFNHQCVKGATIEREGKWYCKTHDPVRVAQRHKNLNDEIDAKIEALHERDAREERQNSAHLEAVEKLKEIERCCHPDGLLILPDSILADSIRRIIKDAS